MGVLALAAMVAMGCSSSGDVIDDGPTGPEELPERSRYGNLSTDGLSVEKVDLDGSGQPDQWIFSDESGQVVRIERDMNFDGRVDVWEYYRDGELIEEEKSLDSTPYVDAVVFYVDDEIRRQKMSSKYDGTFAIEKFFGSDGKLQRVERDTSEDGQVDTWDYYDNGTRIRVGWDTTGDGQPDRFQEY